MNKEESIQKAKDLAKLDYEITCRRLYIRNLGQQRTWKRIEFKDGNYGFVFGESVGFVFVYPKEKKAIACRRSKEKIKEFIYDMD